jgi:hypothetical protein
MRAAGAGVTREVTAAEAAIITELMRAAESVRGLRFERAVPVLVQDRAAIMAFARTQFDQAELARAHDIYAALGLLPAGLDLANLLVELLGEQIVGYYDERNSQLVVRDEVMRAFEQGDQRSASELGEARLTLIHELVHALQDQRLGLSAHLRLERDMDAENAFKALYEGDAMLAMTAFSRIPAGGLADASSTAPLVPPDEVASRLHRSRLAGTRLGRAPAIVRVPLLFAYLDGLSFAAQLFARGGWADVNRAFAQPPESTEQVLHPNSTREILSAQRPRILEARTSLGGDYELLHEDTLGELELSVYFGMAMPEARGRQAAAGWGGDRLYLYRSPSQQERALLWLTRWDSPAEADEAERAALQVRRLASPGSQLVLRRGRSMLIVRNTPAALHASLRARFANGSLVDGSLD